MFVGACLMLGVSVYMVNYLSKAERASTDIYNEVQTLKSTDNEIGKMNNTKEPEETPSDDSEGRDTDHTQVEVGEDVRSSFQKLKDANKDYVGWITIPNTVIDYPVVKGKDNEFYLEHDFYGNYNLNGTIFADIHTVEPFYSDVTVLHGHHMKNGSMFRNLTKFKDEKFAKANNRFTVEIDTSMLTYEIFSVFYDKADKDNYIFDFENVNQFISYYDYLKGKSLFDISTSNINSGDKIIILSTCSYEQKDNRLLVCAKLVYE